MRYRRQDVLELLFEHKAAFIRDFLRENGIRASGTKPEMRERLVSALERQRIRLGEVLELLNRIEGWGNQHLYLFRSSAAMAQRWKEETRIHAALAQNGTEELLNATLPVVLPAQRQLVSIRWTEHRLRIIWVDKRQWEEREEELDEERGEDIILKAYRQQSARGVHSFDWDLDSRHAMLMIRALPRGSQYEPIRDELAEELKPLIELDDFRTLRVSRAIERLEASEEVRSRQVVLETTQRSRARFTSAGRSRDANEDPSIRRSRAALGQTSKRLGNFYWLSGMGPLTQDLHTVLYGDLNRIGIRGQHNEESIRYVIGRVRHHCR